MYAFTHSELEKVLDTYLHANIIPFIKSSPGLGKSDIVKQLAERHNLHLIDMRLSQMQPYDLAGLVHPKGDKFEYLPLDEFILDTDAIPNNKDGVLLFLDEFNSIDKYTASACYKLLLNRQIGKHNLHPKTRIICAGNLSSDNAIVNNIGSAIQSRVSHLNLVLDEHDWIHWLNEQKDWHSTVVSFLNFNKKMVSTFDPSKTEEPYAVPRTWFMLSNMFHKGLDKLPKDLKQNVIVSIVGSKAGMELVTFLDNMDQFPTIEDITNNPETAKMPSSAGSKWALGNYLATNINEDNADAFLTYVSRIVEFDIQRVVLSMMAQAYPYLKEKPKLLEILEAID